MSRPSLEVTQVCFCSLLKIAPASSENNPKGSEKDTSLIQACHRKPRLSHRVEMQQIHVGIRGLNLSGCPVFDCTQMSHPEVAGRPIGCSVCTLEVLHVHCSSQGLFAQPTLRILRVGVSTRGRPTGLACARSTHSYRCTAVCIATNSKRLWSEDLVRQGW